MKIKSAILTQASGSVGGLTASHNRGGMYFRARTIPTNPQTSRQTAVRNLLATLSANWQTLSAANQQTWNDYGANVPLTDALGDPIYLTGQQHYIRSNTARQQAGLSALSAGPNVYNLGEFTPPTFTADATQDEIDISFTAGDDWVSEDGAAMIIRQGLTVSPGKSFFKGPFRYLGVIEGDATTPPTSPSTFSTPSYGLSADNLTWLAVRVCRADGRLSSLITVGPETIT